jgi:mono/diheme cytochrome c family protein
MKKKPFKNTWVLGAMLLGTLVVATACGPVTEPTPSEMAPTATTAEASPTAGELPTVTTEPTGEPPGETPSPTAEAATPSSGPSIPATPDPAVGQQIWAEKPCSGCHGANAGGGVGPRLAGTGLSFDQVLLQVRTGAPPMPAFSESQVSDLEVRHIYSWLRSLAASTPTQASSGLPPTAALMSTWQHVNDMKVKSDFAKDLPERQASDDAGRLSLLKQYAGEAIEQGEAALIQANQALNDISDEGVRAIIRQVIDYTNQVIDHGNAALSSNSFSAAWPEAAEMVRICRLDAWPLATQSVRDVGLNGTVRVQVTDPAGNPMNGALVTVLTSHTPVGVSTDSAGRVTIANVAAVPALQVKAYDEGMVYHEVHINLSAGSVADARIALPAPSAGGQTPSVAGAGIQPSSGAGNATVAFSVTATDPQGRLNLAEDQIFALNPSIGLAYVLRHTGGDQYSAQVTLPGLSPGTHTWYFFAVDHQCNTSNILSASYTVG